MKSFNSELINKKAKLVVEKKNYTQMKNKGVVKNKNNNDKIFKQIVEKLAAFNQQNENKGQIKPVIVVKNNQL